MLIDAEATDRTGAVLAALGVTLPKRERLGGRDAAAHRSARPEETLARFGRHARAMGVTRIGNVTGLDDIGIPAAIAVRPASLSVSVAMGKGLTLAHARASALMEAAEGFHGEHIEARFRRASEHALLRSGAALVSPRALCRTGAAYDPRREIDWIDGVDLLSHRPCWVPAASVHTDCTRPVCAAHDIVLSGSNGLASGNHLLEAMASGICELIERDAVALWHARGLLDRASRRLDLASVTDADGRALLDRYAAAGIAVHVWQVATDLDVPVYVCDIPALPGGHAPSLRRFRGAGCHPEPAAALARALTEAAQSRLNRIAGLRDDLTPEGYVETMATAGGGALLDALSDAAEPLDFAAVPRFASDDVADDVRWLLARLASRGFDQVAVVDLTRAELGIPVLRVVIPGLEWDGDHPGYRPGARAMRVLTGST